MATKQWLGAAASVAQVTKIVYSSIVVGQTYSAIINGKTISYTTTTTVLGDLIDALVSAWNSSAEPEIQEMVAARREDPTLSGLQLTAQAGVGGIVVTASATTGTATVTTPTAASGPNFWNVAANWVGGTVPSAADDIEIDGAVSSVSILYGLTDTNNYASFKRMASYQGQIGLPATNPNGYQEYRTRRLTLGTGSAIAVELGYGTGNHPTLEYYDFQGSNVTLTVHGTTANTSNGYPAQIVGTGSGTTANVYAGSVKFDSLSTSTVSTINVIQREGGQSTPDVHATSKVTCTTVLCVGGQMLIEGAMTTLTARDSARVVVAKASAAANVKASNRAQIDWDSSGGITTKATIEPSGIINFGNVGTTKTVAACDLYRDGEIRDPNGRVTFTTGIVLIGCRIADVKVDKGVGITL